MWALDWWWRLQRGQTLTTQQNILGEYATIAPLILSTDKTYLTVFSGNKKAWLVYLTIGNISKEIRKRPSEHAVMLVGYIPVASLGCISNDEERSERRWQLFHTCMEAILEPIKEMAINGEEMLCADGGVRRVHPILAAYIADFPEQSRVACVRKTRCPKCWAPPRHLADLSKRYKQRQKRQTLDALQDHWDGYSRTINILGIRPTKPFWADLPYTEISTCLTPDLLHQLHKGVFGEHIVKWCTAILGKCELDRRTRGMPRFSNLCHFSEGISVLSQWTGKEAKALGSVFLPAMAGCAKGEAVAAARGIIDFMYRAHLPELSGDDLAAMDRDLETFHDARYVFVDENKAGLLNSKGQFNNIPKIHMLSHYTHTIRELGTPDGYNMEMTERLHIDCVKVAWRASSHINTSALKEMATYLQRKEAWVLLRAYLLDTGQIRDGKGVELAEDNDDSKQEIIQGAGEAKDGVWYPTPTIWAAKHPALGRKIGTYLIHKHHAPDLIPATIRYLKSLVIPGTPLAISKLSLFKVWSRCKLRHKRLPFFPAFEPHTDQIQATPQSVDDEGRMLRFRQFDVVLIDSGSQATGLHRKHSLLDGLGVLASRHGLGFKAGRVCAIFELPQHMSSICSEKLVYVELFRPFSATASFPVSLYTTGHMMRDNQHCAMVMPLSCVRMACHLTPRYHLFDPQHPINHTSDLLVLHNSFYLNKYASQFIYVVLEYWQKRLWRLNPQTFYVTEPTIATPRVLIAKKKRRAAESARRMMNWSTLEVAERFFLDEQLLPLLIDLVLNMEFDSTQLL
ncbi:hypothetical protein FRC07_005943 [Ceratobasidium sp. 392]|nr:hypothetical protein FRC07_005943 [Ceratobasidium sp. 392]